MGKRYNIAFKGEVASGFDVSEVKAIFAERFRKSDLAVDRIFSGNPITLAKDLEWERANTAVTRLLEFGAIVYLVDQADSTLIDENAKSANDSDVNATLDPDSSIYAKMDNMPQDFGAPTIVAAPVEEEPETIKARHLSEDSITDDEVAAACNFEKPSEPETLQAEQVSEDAVTTTEAREEYEEPQYDAEQVSQQVAEQCFAPEHAELHEGKVERAAAIEPYPEHVTAEFDESLKLQSLAPMAFEPVPAATDVVEPAAAPEFEPEQLATEDVEAVATLAFDSEQVATEHLESVAQQDIEPESVAIEYGEPAAAQELEPEPVAIEYDEPAAIQEFEPERLADESVEPAAPQEVVQQEAKPEQVAIQSAEPAEAPEEVEAKVEATEESDPKSDDDLTDIAEVLPEVVVESLDGDPVADLTQTAKVRHLSQIMDKRVLSARPVLNERKASFRYRFDTFMARGGGSIFKALTAVFIVAFLLIGVARGVLMYFMPETGVQHEDIGFLGNLYITFLEITDPGNMAQDIYSSAALKIFAVLAGLAGIVMLSALIAFITTTLDQKIYELKRGRSKVIEEGHTLILGWNEQRITEIVRELALANESEKDACVVILADKDKEEMDDVLRLRIKNLATTRLVTRSGDVSTLSNLDMVSLESAKSVIILAACDDTDSAELKASSDAKAIQTVLATMGNEEGKDEFSVVVEIFNPTHRDIVRSSFPDHVITVNTSDILAKLLVQTSRSVGLSVVYNEILSFDGCEMYFYDAEWNNAKFGEVGYRFPDGVPVGIRDADGKIHMNPPAHRILDANDEILIVADDDSTIEFRSEPVAQPTEHELSGIRHEQRIERELMLGWTFKSPIIIREFADYIMAGSAIHVLLKKPTQDQRNEIEALQRELEEIDIRLLEKDCLNIEELMSVRPFDYDNIIILAGSEGDGQPVDAGRVDSENIVALLLLRRIFSQYPVESKNTKLITEILDSQNDALVARAGVQDVIISNRLVSMIMAQISESADIEVVYDDIFQEDGSEIYLKPASLYFNELPKQVSFADMMAIAQKREEVCIGVKIKALEPEKEHNNGVQLIPEKNTLIELQPEDSFVVLAEDEL